MQDNPTEHTLYTVFGAPKVSYGNYTKSNLIEAVGKATGESTEAEIASTANDNVGASVYGRCICANGFQVNFDAAMGRYPASDPKGMCCCRAEGLDCVLNVLGIGPYTHDYVNECPEPNPHYVYYNECTICDETVVRNYWDGFWNNWEGVVKSGGTASTCYAPSEGSIGIDQGTYSQIDAAIAANCGYYWRYLDAESDDESAKCSHLQPPQD
jgi:hypothetical protein